MAMLRRWLVLRIFLFVVLLQVIWIWMGQPFEETISESHDSHHTISMIPNQEQFDLVSKNTVITGSPSRINDTETPRILLVHVGKAGGETLKHILRVGCLVRMGPIKQRECLKQLLGGEANLTRQVEPMLSKRVTAYLHYDRLYPPRKDGTMTNVTHFLFTVRHPVERVQSWFRYVSPRNCLIDAITGDFEDKRSINCRNLQAASTDPTSWQARFFGCFPSLSAMASALRESKASNCTRLLAEALVYSNRGAEGVTGHLAANYEYYHRRTLAQFPKKTVFVVRTERLWEDITTLDIFLGGNGKFQTEGFRYTHESERFPDRADLTAAEFHTFCCVLHKELSIYIKLIKQSENLKDAEKNETLQYALGVCGSTGWLDLLQTCGLS